MARGVVEQHGESCGGVDTEVIAALRTDERIFLESLSPDDLAAAVAFLPQTFGFDVTFAFGTAFDRRLLARKPSHA